MAWLVNDHPFTPLKKNLSENAAMCFTAISSLSRVADSLYWSYNVHKYIHVYCFIRGFCLRGRLITHKKKDCAVFVDENTTTCIPIFLANLMNVHKKCAAALIKQSLLGQAQRTLCDCVQFATYSICHFCQMNLQTPFFHGQIHTHHH